MRAVPSTATVLGTYIRSSGGTVGTDNWAIYSGGAWRGCWSIAATEKTAFTIRLEVTAYTAGNLVSGGACGLYGGANCGFEIDAEL